MTLSNYMMRKRTLDDINIMRDEFLRLPENLKEWRAMLGILQEESMRIKKKKKLELPKNQYQQWEIGFSIYCKAVKDRKDEALFLIKEQNIIKAKNKNQSEQSIMFKAVHEALDFMQVDEINLAQLTLENCIEQIKGLRVNERSN